MKGLYSVVRGAAGCLAVVALLSCGELADPIIETNAPPVADAGGPYAGPVGASIEFDGTGSSDPDGDTPLTYAWDFGDGGTGAGATPGHTYAASGTYTASLVVTDARGLESEPAEATVEVSVNQAPVADAGGPYAGETGEAIDFDGTGSSDPDGDTPLTYAWDFGDGGTGTGATPSHTYGAGGTYTVTLVVTDARGLESEPAEATAEVAAPNQAPVADAGGPYAGETGEAIDFDGTGSSDPDGDTPLSYAWDFGDGGAGTGATPSHTYAAGGTYTVTLVVTDARGLESEPAEATAEVAAVGSSVVLVGAGDIGDCTSEGDEATADLLDGIAGTVFTTGDNAYPDGTAEDFADCYDPSWGRHKDRTRPSPGNHDYHTEGAADYFAYFGAAAGDPDRGYYSYELGDWHIIVLNSEVDVSAGSAQEEWLRADLAANPALCTLAYWHQPRFSSASHGSQSFVQPLWDALYEYGADVVLAGHDHVYERFAPQTPDGELDAAAGIRQFVVGTGGRRLYDFDTAEPNSEVRYNDTFGVLELTLAPTGYAWDYHPVSGSFQDSGAASCH